MRRSSPVLVVVAVLALCAAGLSRAGDAKPNIAFHLDLLGALVRAETAPGAGAVLQADLVCGQGIWERVWAEAPSFNKGLHLGYVRNAKIDPERMALDLAMVIEGDAWVKGGKATYQVELQRQPDGSFQGTFKGVFAGRAVSGKAQAAIVPQSARARTDCEPAVPGEHPRLMFRKKDLEELRKKAATPFGQEALAKFTGPIGLGLKHQLLGDKAAAEAAIPLVEKLMADKGVGDKMVRGRCLGWRMEQVALAYDLCYDVWPEKFRKEVEAYFLQDGFRPFLNLGSFQKEINWQVTSPHPGPIRYGPGLGALAIWGEKGPEPVPPAEPNATVHEIAPDAGAGGEGVPVCAYVSDLMPSDWLIAAGFQPKPGEDPLAGAGGLTGARPKPGLEVSYGGKTAKFAPLAKEHVAQEKARSGERHGPAKIEMVKATNRSWDSTSYLYTVIEMDQDRLVQVRTNDRRDTVALAGTALKDGDFARLKKGRYPLLCAAPIGRTSDWGVIFKQPRLADAEQKDVDDVLAQRREDHEFAVLDYKLNHALWESSGGGNILTFKLFELSRQFMYQYCREAVGTGGYKGAKFFSFEGPNKYMAAFRNMFCRNVSPFADVPAFLPRQMFTTVFRPDGKPLWVEMDGTEGFHTSEYIEKYDTKANILGLLFPLVPDDLKPGVLWAWNYHMGVTSKADAAKVLNEAGRPTTGYPSDSHPAWVFVHYPLEMAPVPPAKAMPLTWEAPDYGWYAFRNNWEGKDDSILQVFLRRGPCGGENAGAYRLTALGQVWTAGEGFVRFFENVVQLPNDEINNDARGRLLSRHAEADGSGVLTMDLGDVYSGDAGGRLYELRGNVRRDDAFKDIGIRGLRSIGVDYSGKCGAPCLLAIADKVEGGGQEVWSFPFASERFGVGGLAAASEAKEKGETLGYAQLLKKFSKEAAAQIEGWKKSSKEWPAYAAGREKILKELKVDGPTFTITRGDATLRGYALGDQPVTVSVGDIDRMDLGAKCSLAYSVCTGLSVKGANSYLVVMTVQRGEPPAIKVEGEGLGARVRVGQRVVRFDGQKVVFE